MTSLPRPGTSPGTSTARRWATGRPRSRTMTLPIAEFMRRFLQHVLPTGLVKVRYFGFLSPNAAAQRLAEAG
ncbi:MAG: transposase [Burkholderiales bacterium]